MPIVNGLEADFEGQIDVIRLNVEEADNARIQQAFGLRGHPSAAVLDAEGEVTHRFFGAESAETLRAALQDVAPDDSK